MFLFEQPGNYCLNSQITNGTRCRSEVDCRITMARQLSTRNRIFTGRMVIKIEEKLVKCSVWSMTLRGAETWKVRKVDQKHLDSSES